MKTSLLFLNPINEYGSHPLGIRFGSQTYRSPLKPSRFKNPSIQVSKRQAVRRPWWIVEPPLEGRRQEETEEARYE